MSKAKVYFTKDITPENVVRLYEKLGGSCQARLP